MAPRCLVIPIESHRVRRRGRRNAAAFDSQRDEALEQLQLRFVFWCFAVSALLTAGLTLAR